MFRSGPASVWHILTRRGWLRLVGDYTDDCKGYWSLIFSVIPAVLFNPDIFMKQMTKKARPKAYRQYKLHFHNWEQNRKLFFPKTGIQGETALKGKYLKP